MSEISKFIKQEVDWLFNEEVGHVEPENFDAVYESVTGDFRLGAIAIASQIKNIFQILTISKDENSMKVVEYLNEFINQEVETIELGRKYL